MGIYGRITKSVSIFLFFNHLSVSREATTGYCVDIDLPNGGYAMRTDLPVRPKLDERIKVALAADEKRLVFEVAAKQRTSVSDFVRRAIVQAANSPTAA